MIELKELLPNEFKILEGSLKLKEKNKKPRKVEKDEKLDVPNRKL